MDDTSRTALDLIEADKKVGWVRDQLSASFTEGITQSAKDRFVVEGDFLLGSADLTPRERVKREKYETSRPYDEAERVELIRFALREVFVTVPAVQLAAIGSLADLGAKAIAIEFTAPDDEERGATSAAHRIEMEPAVAEDLRHRFDMFNNKLAL